MLYDGAVFLKDFYMNKTEIKLQYDICDKKDSAIPVIIVAAGTSSRMGGINKQFMPVLGVPVIVRTLMAFEHSSDISKIIVVTAKESVPDVQMLCEKYAIGKVCDIVVGGLNRHQSVIAGIECLSNEDKKVLIHDGARPFIDSNTIGAVVDALNCFDSALCVSKINDTVKKVSGDGVVLSTVDRSMLYAAQTPQGIDVAKYKIACQSIANVEALTDDASIMEEAGYSVKAIVGSSKNIKITTPDDIAIAEALVRGEDEV